MKILLSNIKKDNWHRWFAWYPITCLDDDAGRVYLVWLQYINRRIITEKNYNTLYEITKYKFIEDEKTNGK